MEVYMVCDSDPFSIEGIYELEDDAKNHCERYRHYDYSSYDVIPPVKESNKWRRMTDEDIGIVANALKENVPVQSLSDEYEWLDFSDSCCSYYCALHDIDRIKKELTKFNRAGACYRLKKDKCD